MCTNVQSLHERLILIHLSSWTINLISNTFAVAFLHIHWQVTAVIKQVLWQKPLSFVWADLLVQYIAQPYRGYFLCYEKVNIYRKWKQTTPLNMLPTGYTGNRHCSYFCHKTNQWSGRSTYKWKTRKNSCKTMQSLSVSEHNKQDRIA